MQCENCEQLMRRDWRNETVSHRRIEFIERKNGKRMRFNHSPKPQSLIVTKLLDFHFAWKQCGPPLLSPSSSSSQYSNHFDVRSCFSVLFSEISITLSFSSFSHTRWRTKEQMEYNFGIVWNYCCLRWVCNAAKLTWYSLSIHFAIGKSIEFFAATHR